MRHRRRAERGHFSSRVRTRQARQGNERRLQRLLIVGTGVLIALLFMTLTAGWVFTSYLPPRTVVATVDDEQVQLREVVPYTQLDAMASGFVEPRGALNNYVRDMLLRNHADDFGITVTEQQRTEFIASRFDQGFDPEAPPDTLTEEARAAFDRFLQETNMQESDFRRWAEGQLLRQAFREHFLGEVPERAEQVFLRWVVVENARKAQEAVDRIEGGEEFGEVAADLNTEHSLANEQGQVGWVPEGALPELHGHLFGENATYNDLVGPLEIPSIGNVVLFVGQPGEHAVSGEMRERVANHKFQEWMSDRVDEQVSNDADLTEANVRWVIDRLT